ncbi:response regulator [Methylopila sp. Yamaguchi]|uniref:response regulator n=1 Tax=Methylopila sp. Yamaguchi TaxID=1437817 RepID=UPI000CBDEE9C|nr:response regulator transcription factor [Methylopila sp. Yamaguchi]GBD46930.1 two component response regulator, LuxR family [Methylopila sp. Yamaguchi]
MSDLTILLVDDHPVVRAGYRKLIELQPGYRVTGEADSTAAAYLAYRREPADIVVVDLSMPGSSGLEAIRRIRAVDRKARILVFTMHEGLSYALKAFEAGAAGYVTKSSPPEALIAAIATIAAGGKAVSDDIAHEIAVERLSGRKSPLDALGPREVEILQLIASGMTTDEIADALSLSQKTIQNYHSGIKAKLNARTDANLVWVAIDAGLLEMRAAGGGPA